jgi:hypothetical protein
MNVTAWRRWSRESQEYSLPHLRLRVVAKLVNEMQPRSYADLGCAEGVLSTLTPGLKYIGIDFVEPNPPPTFEFYQCDFNSQPLPKVLGNVELITCSGILEYIEDLPAFLGGIRDVTRPGTKLILTYVNMNHISRAAALLRNYTFSTHPDWRNFFSPRDLQLELVEAGFDVGRVIPVGVSVSKAPPVKKTVSGTARILPNFKGAYLLAHHFIWILTR